MVVVIWWGLHTIVVVPQPYLAILIDRGVSGVSISCVIALCCAIRLSMCWGPRVSRVKRTDNSPNTHFRNRYFL